MAQFNLYGMSVLNAFRHQRMNHTDDGPASHADFSRAQRLSASTNESRPVRDSVNVVVNVLNAFRHQRMNHSALRSTQPVCR